ncbi:MAG: anaerobic ribonucleoside-triphosphate reductase [Promethearchaeota archaeon]|nr:MAG: anaerobic ribonucleoside-triphosphate reductase [Candidatus Lokiarchaeota archaeon]
MDLLPKVFRTEGNIAKFDPSKIFESILKETGMSETDAKHITELVVRRIISSGIKFLSGPHIREIVCSILSEQHFENERKLYTRIGMPLMDYEEILEKGPSNKLNELITPEKIHHWAANQIAEEYAHLRILDNEESKAHLAGDIHINGLNYFDLRPYSQIWDPRLILKNGLPPINSSAEFYKEKPAKNLNYALYHLSKWLGMIQSEFYGNQGFNFITTFLAPYLRDMAEEDIIQKIKKLIYEINQLSVLIGREISQISISSSLSIFKAFSEVPAIGPNGKVKDVYENYHEESMKLFKAFIIAFKGGYDSRPILSPLHQIILDNRLVDDIDKIYLKFWEDIEKMNSSYFLNLCEEKFKEKILKQESTKNNYSFGTLQNISLNLPRYAYNSQNEDTFLELLNSKINLCSKILLKKFEIIKKRINTNHLRFCSSLINGEPLFKLDNQSLSISLVGLNESIKYLTDFELHEHPEAINLSKKILTEINRLCSELTENNNIKFILSENLSKNAIHRFTKLDLKMFPKDTRLLSNNQSYTNSVHFLDDVKMNILKRIQIQGEFHKFIHEGAIEYISLNDIIENNFTIRDFIRIICNESTISCLNLYS